MNVWRPVGFSLKIFLILFLCIKDSLADSRKPSDTMVKMKAVTDKILNGYDKLIRPTEEGSNTTEVWAGFMPRQILEVDEERALFVLDGYFFLNWQDIRLQWDLSTEYDGLLQLPDDLLWKPEITVHNSHSMRFQPTEEVLLTVTHSGNVYWFPPMHTSTSCEALLEVSYPYDTVTCIVEMGSWVHHGWDIDFSHGENFYMHNFLNINPRWELIESEAKVVRNVTFSTFFNAPFICIHAMFPLKRRIPPEIETTRNPCIIIMLLTLSIFWLPTNSSKKLILGGILFLALVILLVYVARSTKFPLRAIFATSFLQSTMYMVVSTLLFQILVIFNLCNISGPVRPPPAIMKLLTGPFGKYACLRTSFSSDNIPIDRVQFKDDTPNCIESPSPNEDWKLFAAALDRLFFVIMSIAMIAVHHL